MLEVYMSYMCNVQLFINPVACRRISVKFKDGYNQEVSWVYTELIHRYEYIIHTNLVYD